MTLLTLDHSGFTVSDLERSIAWYADLLGTEPAVRRRSADPYLGEMVGYPGCDMEFAYFPLPGSDSMLELIQYLTPEPGTVGLETTNVGNGHICLLVDDLQAEFERLSRTATFRSAAPVQITAGANAGGWGLYLRDPDGISIQLTQKPSRREPPD
jgi:catechol 2,3-dioxygenase-like lactoylglutathione lyase family enzyme